MLPLTLAKVGEENIIVKLSGRSDTRKFLENLGFVEGSTVILISENSGGIIVNIKGTRIAISREMAAKIMV